MSTEITWLGHNAWAIQAGEHRLLLDPFLNDNPLSPKKAGQVEADFILVSHGHGDHLGDTVEIAARTGATVIAIFEVCQWLSARGVKNVHAMNLGGGYPFPFGRLTMTLALHSSSMPDGSYAGNPCGFVLAREEGIVYFACDTALFSDMKLIGAAASTWRPFPSATTTRWVRPMPWKPSACSSPAASCRSTTAPGRSSPRMPMVGPARFMRKPASRPSCSNRAARSCCRPSTWQCRAAVARLHPPSERFLTDLCRNNQRKPVDT